jgi:hypothetical protein
MYFAINPPLGTLPAQIAQEFTELREALSGPPSHASLRLYALVDGAFDESFFSARYPRTAPPLSLYTDTALQGLGIAAPHLLAAPNAVHEVQGWLSHLFSVANGKPMLSLIASPLSVAQLARHMRPYLIAMTSDSVQWPVRWGDTRVLAGLIDGLSESMRSQLLAPMVRWWHSGRDGGLLHWRGAKELPMPPDFDKLPLGDDVFAALVDAAEPDSVLANLYDSQPDLLDPYSPAECHTRVARHLQIATFNGIHSAPARQHFCALALLLTDDFTQHAAMAELLMRTKRGENYGDEIASLSDHFWRSTER